MKKKLIYRIVKFFPFIFMFIIAYAFMSIIKAEKGNHTAKTQIAVVFGAAVKSSGKLFGAILYRTQSVIQLYHSGKIKKIIFTGSDLGYKNIGEASAMRIYARRNGIPEKDIYIDRNGDNTKKSIENVNQIILADKNLVKYKFSTLFISQDYHLARIQLLAKRYGFAGFTYPAHGKPLKKEWLFILREIFAYLYTLFFKWP